MMLATLGFALAGTSWRALPAFWVGRWVRIAAVPLMVARCTSAKRMRERLTSARLQRVRQETLGPMGTRLPEVIHDVAAGTSARRA